MEKEIRLRKVPYVDQYIANYEMEEERQFKLCIHGIRELWRYPARTKKLWLVVSDRPIENSYPVVVDKYAARITLSFGGTMSPTVYPGVIEALRSGAVGSALIPGPPVSDYGGETYRGHVALRYEV